ncbi:MAG: acylphosphatase [Patescibacteria group bacterium]
MIKRLSIQVTGLVQGVFFRHTAKQTAASLGLTGFVRNEGDGSVQLEVQGEELALQKFQEWCQMGSSSSQVELVQAGEIPLKEDEQNFSM